MRYLLLLLLPLFLHSCMSNSELVTKAANHYCNCTAGAMSLLERFNTAEHKEKMAMLEEINDVVETLGTCFERSKWISKLQGRKDKMRRTEALQLDQDYYNARAERCPDVQELIDGVLED